ncbi:hypothetical protein [Streptomyces sp. NPDC090445]|uniref:nSTAND1 domain-containing NTPase n=1 Tax=Streptomyces sp. NPDC090445 TaxID=3365963 RepID=UPI0037F8FD3E
MPPHAERTRSRGYSAPGSQSVVAPLTGAGLCAVRRRPHGRRCGQFGPSGSGKSSLLRAGLIPALRQAQDVEVRPAALRILTPGPRPARTHGLVFNPPEARLASNGADTFVIVGCWAKTTPTPSPPGVTAPTGGAGMGVRRAPRWLSPASWKRGFGPRGTIPTLSRTSMASIASCMFASPWARRRAAGGGGDRELVLGWREAGHGVDLPHEGCRVVRASGVPEHSAGVVVAGGQRPVAHRGDLESVVS